MTPRLQPGDRVRDTTTDRVGIFQGIYDWRDPAIVPGPDNPAPTRRMAFIRPVGGGREWMTPPERVIFA